MSNISTNDTSHILSQITVPNYLNNVKDTLESEIEGFINYFCDEQKKKDSMVEFIEDCDKEYDNNFKDKGECYYTKMNPNINLKFIEKKRKNENEYNIIDNYNIITKTVPIIELKPNPNPKLDPKSEPKIHPNTVSLKTFLLNKRSKLFKEEICKESYQINKKFKLKENLLLIILIKKKEEEKQKEKEKEKKEEKKEEKEKVKEEKKEEEKEEDKENNKDKILILLIKEKKIRDKNEDGNKDKKEDKKENKKENKNGDKNEDKKEDKKKNEKNDRDKDKKEDEYEDEKNKNFTFIPDNNFHIFYKKYNFSFEIPQVDKNFYSYLLNKNGKEEIILFFWCEKILYLFKIENIDDEYNSIITKYTFNLDFEPIFIIPIKNIENRFFLEKDIVFFTEYFLIITKENFKLCKCIEKARKLFICNVEYEFKRENDKKSIEGKNLIDAEQLDNGLIAIHLKDEQSEEIAYFYLHCKDYFYDLFYKKMMFKIFLFKLNKKINNNN